MLVKCSQCGSQVAHTAKACPKCGAEGSAKIPTYQEWAMERWVLIISESVGIGILIWALDKFWGCFGGLKFGLLKYMWIGLAIYWAVTMISIMPTRRKYDKLLS